MNLQLDANAETFERLRRNFQRLATQAAPIVAVLATNAADSTPVGNTAAETVFSTVYSLPRNEMRIGRRLGILSSGTIECASSCNVRFKLRAGNVAMLDTGDLALSAPLVGAAWTIEAESICRQIGAAGQMATALRFGQVHGDVMSIVPALASVNLSVDQVIGLSVTFSVAHAGNVAIAKVFRVDGGN